MCLCVYVCRVYHSNEWAIAGSQLFYNWLLTAYQLASACLECTSKYGEFLEVTSHGRPGKKWLLAVGARIHNFVVTLTSTVQILVSNSTDPYPSHIDGYASHYVYQLDPYKTDYKCLVMQIHREIDRQIDKQINRWIFRYPQIPIYCHVCSFNPACLPQFLIFGQGIRCR